MILIAHSARHQNGAHWHKITRSWMAVMVALMIVGPVIGALAANRVPIPLRKPDVQTLFQNQKLPKPYLVTSSDTRVAKVVFKALDANRFKDALRYIGRAKSPDVVRVLVWSYLTANRSPAKFNDVQSFLDRQEDWGHDWPKRKTMLAKAEATMPPSLTASDVLAWFQVTGGPVSDPGRIREADALFKLGQHAQSIRKIRDLWIQGNFTKTREKRFYRRHKKHLRPVDHVARLERLVWDEKFWPARRQIWKVSEARRKLAVARLWLMRREGNVDKAIKDVAKTAPNLITHAGLIFERARWRRRKGRNADAAQLILDYSGDLIRPDKWWPERAVLARSFLREDQPQKAYQLVSQHGLGPEYAAKYADAQWMSGWIQLQFLNNAIAALPHFTAMYKAVKYPISLSRGAYWAGRAAHKLGKNAQAKAWYEKAARHSTTYYGQLAFGVLAKPSPQLLLKKLNPAGQKLIRRFENNAVRRAAQILAEMGEGSRMRPFIVHLADVNTSAAWLQLTADFATRYGRPDLAIYVAKNAERLGLNLGTAGYPRVKLPHNKHLADPVESPLVYAVIRQESAYYTGAKSSAGARGLMQVMPATAKRVAKANRLPYNRDRLTQDATYNLTLGQAYLTSVVNQFSNSYPLALAAYNAGPHRVKRWMKSFGDPRTDANNQNVLAEFKPAMIDWIEMIPYTETRNYVQRVLGNATVYRLNSSPR